jgi:thiopurine S-methyltransferase
MDTDFWLDRWRRNQTGFHEPQANPLLVAHFASLSVAAGNRIFVPLCGMTLDIQWLLSGGYRVAGVELSQIAIRKLFAALGVTPSATSIGPITRYSAPGIDLFQGDIFALTPGDLGPVDAVYDRAALIALPAALRARYAQQVERLTRVARQLIIGLRYDQQSLTGPPFSVDGAELERVYGRAYELRSLGSVDIVGGLKGKCPASEDVWLLTALP